MQESSAQPLGLSVNQKQVWASEVTLISMGLTNLLFCRQQPCVGGITFADVFVPLVAADVSVPLVAANESSAGGSEWIERDAGYVVFDDAAVIVYALLQLEHARRQAATPKG